MNLLEPVTDAIIAVAASLLQTAVGMLPMAIAFGGFAWGAIYLKRWLIEHMTDDERMEIYIQANGIRSKRKRDGFLNDRLGKDHGFYEMKQAWKEEEEERKKDERINRTQERWDRRKARRRRAE